MTDLVTTLDPSRASAAVARNAAVTAAICTHNRTSRLRRALRSLEGQTVPAAEIVVVDNAPEDDATRYLVEEEFPGVRYVRESVPGLDFARNRAIAVARHPIVAFLDDDAVAEPGWVEAIAAAFHANPRLGACTGRVEALTLETEGQRLFEANGGFARGTEPIRLPQDSTRLLRGRRAPLIAWSISVGSGCSLAVARDAVRELGGFDEALDLGSALPGGGDLDMLWRLLDAGLEVLYEPTVAARHEHRADREGAIHQIIGHHRGLVAALTKALVTTRGRTRVSVLAFLLWRLLKPGVRLVRSVARRDPLPPKAVAQLWWNCWTALGAYPAARRLAANRRSALRRPGPLTSSPVDL